MMEFYASFFVESTNKLMAWEKVAGESKPEEAANPPAVVQLYAEIGCFSVACQAHNFTSSALQCGRITKNMEDKRMRLNCGELREGLRALRERFEDDLKADPLFQLSSAEIELYKNPNRGWEKISRRFPKTRIDIEESSKCFAFARYGASLFHILLVAEHGVIELAAILNVAGDKPGWGALDRLEKISAKAYKDKSDLEKRHSDLLNSVIPFAQAIKNQWRNKINHVDNRLVWANTDFSPDMAESIIKAVRGFMDKLVSGLPKP
jgi:hypothetical protein